MQRRHLIGAAATPLIPRTEVLTALQADAIDATLLVGSGSDAAMYRCFLEESVTWQHVPEQAFLAARA